MASPSNVNIVFPRDLSSYSFWFTFNFYQYNVPFAGGQSLPTGSSRPVLTLLGTVRLPMPNSMVDHQDVVYAVEDLGIVAGAALAKFQKTGDWSEAGQAGLTSLGINAAGGLAGGLGSAVGAPKARDVLLQTQGLALNPFLSVMFKSPAFKKHAFKWKLSPVNEQESADLTTLINIFRFNQLPSATAAFSGALLAYPNIVQISVSGSVPPEFAGTSFFSYTFKPSVIESFAVNFTPSGQPSFFGSTGGPTETEIHMSLLEIEYWLQNDYGIDPTTRGNQTSTDISKWLNDVTSKLGNIWKPPPTNVTAEPVPPIHQPNIFP